MGIDALKADHQVLVEALRREHGKVAAAGVEDLYHAGVGTRQGDRGGEDFLVHRVDVVFTDQAAAQIGQQPGVLQVGADGIAPEVGVFRQGAFTGWRVGH